MGQAAGVSGKIIQFMLPAAPRQAKTECDLHAQPQEEQKEGTKCTGGSRQTHGLAGELAAG